MIYLYARYSPRPSAADCESLAVQLDRLRAYAKVRGWSDWNEIREPETSAFIPLSKRPKAGPVVEALARGDHFVVQRVDRAFRNAADALSTVEGWSERGITLHLADLGQSADTSTAGGWMAFAQQAVMADYERRITVDRTRGAMLFHQSNGRAMGGRAPFGKRIVGDRLVDCPEEVRALDLMRRLRSEGKSLARIAELLTAAGYEPRGDRWHAKSISRALSSSAAP